MATEINPVLTEPYIGPVPFETKDEALFFGREGESDELTSLAIAHPVVLMYAQSGAGKTSLMNANVIPKLKKEGYDVLPSARVQGNDCGPRSNIYVFNTLMSWSDGAVGPPTLLTMSLSDFLGGRAHQKNEVDWELPRFLIFDQFEELFTAYPQRWQERRDFFLQIRDALEKDYLLRVIFAMREDYIAELDAYAGLLPERLRTRFRLERPREKAALAAIKKPLDVVETKRRFDKGVAEQLVRNLLMIPADNGDGEPRIGQFVEPVQLQVVCQSLWRAMGPNDDVITFKHLEHCGDVNRALADFYEQCLTAAVAKTNVREGQLRQWFSSTLITSDGTRGIVFRGRERTGEIPNRAVDVLQRLHLIKEEKRGRSRWYELAHDRFIDPIRRSNETWLRVRAGAVEIGQRLESQAGKWVQLGRGTDGLIDEAQLPEAERWAQSPDALDLTPSERVLALISASRAAVDQQYVARQVAQAQLLAAEQHRRLRQFRLGLVVTVVLLIAMSGLTVYAYRQRNAAKDAERVATERKDQAQRSELAAEKARTEAIAQRSAARFQANEAEKARHSAIEQGQLAKDALLEAEKQKAEADAQRTTAELRAVSEIKAREAERRAAEETARARNADRLNQEALDLYRKGSFDEAIEKYRTAQAAYRLDKNGDGEANTLATIGWTYKQQGKYEQAQQALGEALEIRRKTHANEKYHPSIANSLNDLAALYIDTSKEAEATNLLKEALAIRERHPQADSRFLTRTLNDLGLAYYYRRDYANAETYLRRALAINEKDRPGSSEVAINLHNLALIALWRNEFAGAERLYRRALEIQPTYAFETRARTMDGLANIYGILTKYHEAEKLYLETLASRDKQLGAEHPNVAYSLSGLASLYRRLGRYDEALSLVDRALAIRKKAFGAESKEVSYCLELQARLYLIKGMYKKAERLYEQALQIQKKTLGDNDRYVMLTIAELANLHIETEDYDKADPLLEFSRKTLENLPHGNPLDLTFVWSRQARLFRKRGQYSEAESLYTTTLGIREKLYSEGHPEIAMTMTGLGKVYVLQGKYAEAAPLLTKAMAILERVFGSNHADVATAAKETALLYSAQGKDAQADALFKKAIEVYETTLGANHPYLAEALENYAEFLRKNRPAEAVAVAERAKAIRARHAEENKD